MLRYLIVLALAACAYGQQLTPSLIEFLDLTAAQITRLRQNAAEFNRLHGEKSQRYQQVSRELAEETAREVLDPLALGQRYVEQEAICRELRSAHAENMTRNLAVLTEPQRVKLRSLSVVAAEASLASSAAAENLLEPVAGAGFTLFPRNLIFDPLSPVFSNLLGSGGASPVCGIPLVQANPVLIGAAKEVAK